MEKYRVEKPVVLSAINVNLAIGDEITVDEASKNFMVRGKSYSDSGITKILVKNGFIVKGTAKKASKKKLPATDKNSEDDFEYRGMKIIHSDEDLRCVAEIDNKAKKEVQNVSTPSTSTPGSRLPVVESGTEMPASGAGNKSLNAGKVALKTAEEHEKIRQANLKKAQKIHEESLKVATENGVVTAVKDDEEIIEKDSGQEDQEILEESDAEDFESEQECADQEMDLNVDNL